MLLGGVLRKSERTCAVGRGAPAASRACLSATKAFIALASQRSCMASSPTFLEGGGDVPGGRPVILSNRLGSTVINLEASFSPYGGKGYRNQLTTARACICYHATTMSKAWVANKAFLVNPQGKILFLRLAETNQWDVPGGRMELGEHPHEGLVREVLEETGLQIDPSKARPFHVDRWCVRGDQNEPVVGMFYVLMIPDGSLQISSEHKEVLWYDPRQAMPEATSAIVECAIHAYRFHEGIVVAADHEIKGHEGFGLIQLFTGNGKGKTTAALGEVVRAVGAGKRAAVIFFDKGGAHYSERTVLEQLGAPMCAYGRDRIDPVTGRFDFSVTDEDRRLGREGLTKARALVELDKYDLLVLDEINSSTDLGIVSEQEVLALLDQKNDHVELILTGRNAPQSFIDRAHLVTEMRLHKHYFYSGVKAREGLDF